MTGEPRKRSLRHGEGRGGADLESPSDQVSEFVDTPENEPGGEPGELEGHLGDHEDREARPSRARDDESDRDE